MRHPYIRGVLLEQFRAAKAAAGGDPVAAWAAIQADPDLRRAYQQARGKGGLVRTTWDEAVDLIAAAHVHTVRQHGPDRIAGFWLWREFREAGLEDLRGLILTHR